MVGLTSANFLKTEYDPFGVLTLASAGDPTSVITNTTGLTVNLVNGFKSTITITESIIHKGGFCDYTT